MSRPKPKLAETIYVVRGLIEYEGTDMLSGWITEDGAEAEVKILEAHDRTCHDDECTTTHYGKGNYLVDPLRIYHREASHDAF